MLGGFHLIDGDWVGSDQTFASPDIEGLLVAQADSDQIDAACKAARRDFRTFAATEAEVRAALLNRIADEIEALGPQITQTAMAESGLPEARLEGERGRTTGQLRLFAEVISGADYPARRHDAALPDRAPMPRPDLRLMMKPIGPVVVFGASNFPLAFSTAGGDTASALAAGCPVVVKGHGAHAATAELVAQAIDSARRACELPAGVFQMVHGNAPAVGAGLVQHPQIAAVGFTGSLRGGRALFDLCAGRPMPIPFYGELGSINPVFLLPSALSARGTEIATGWAGSLTMGAGQFCTNPGVVVGLQGPEFEAFITTAQDALQQAPVQTMLTDGIAAAYDKGRAALDNRITPVLGSCETASGRQRGPALYRTDAQTFIADAELREEVFGASGIAVACESQRQMLGLAEVLEGQLTATLQMDKGDEALAAQLLPVLEEKAGRILCNGFPTGVEVASAMMHGGPYPASTDVRSTSVGTLAIDRWLRPVSYQNMPTSLLPGALQ